MADQKTILIVDDDPDILVAMRVFLEAAGYAVESALDGESGMQKAFDLRPDLILLDVMMRHDTEGFHVSYRLREDERTKDTPILMVSAIEQKTGMRFSPGSDQEYLPVEEFISKPISPEVLVAKIEEHLGKP